MRKLYEANERYEAVFADPTNGKFVVVCRGFFKWEKQPGYVFPTVEEAIEELSSNAEFLGLN